MNEFTKYLNYLACALFGALMVHLFSSDYPTHLAIAMAAIWLPMLARILYLTGRVNEDEA